MRDEIRDVLGREYTVVGNPKTLPEGWNPSRLEVVCGAPDDYGRGRSSFTGMTAKARFARQNLLGIKAFLLCWKNIDQLRAADNSGLFCCSCVYFDGDELRRADACHDGERYSIAIHLSGKNWFVRALEKERSPSDRSAIEKR